MALREDLDQILEEYRDRIVAALAQYMVEAAASLDSSSLKLRDEMPEAGKLKIDPVEPDVFLPAGRPPDLNPNRAGKDPLLDGFLEGQ